MGVCIIQFVQELWNYIKAGIKIVIQLMEQDNSNEEYIFKLLTLPAELLLYIILFLSSPSDRIKLRHVSRW